MRLRASEGLWSPSFLSEGAFSNNTLTLTKQGGGSVDIPFELGSEIIGVFAYDSYIRPQIDSYDAYPGEYLYSITNTSSSNMNTTFYSVDNFVTFGSFFTRNTYGYLRETSTIYCASDLFAPGDSISGQLYNNTIYGIPNTEYVLNVTGAWSSIQDSIGDYQIEFTLNDEGRLGYNSYIQITNRRNTSVQIATGNRPSNNRISPIFMLISVDSANIS